MNKLVSFFLLFTLISFPNISAKQNINTNLYLLSLNTNQRIQLKKLVANKNTVINFWSIHCVPCKDEIPELVKLKDEFINVQFLFINVDQSSAKKEVIERATEFKIDKDTLLDVYQKALLEFTKSNSVPATFVWNKDKVIFQTIGYTENTISDIRKKISSQNLLEE